MHFGELRKPRYNYNSIYWNGAIYVIGGNHHWSDRKTKIEIWNLKNSPDQFITVENWPQLFDWERPTLFVIPDSFFPDY